MLLHAMFTFILIDASAYNSFCFVLSSDILDGSSSSSSGSGLSSDSLAKGSTTAVSSSMLQFMPYVHPDGLSLTQVISPFLIQCLTAVSYIKHSVRNAENFDP